MVGNIVGEPFKKYVNDQIKTRQEVYGSGFNNSRTPEQINYLNSKLSWVKMASSVIVNPEPNPNAPEQQIIATGQQGVERLKNIGLDINQFKGYNLASHSVLFNGLQQANSDTANKTTDDKGNVIYSDPTVAGKFNNWVTRTGISKSNSIWNNNAYGLGGLEFGIQPQPGITSIKVNHLSRGSIKKATITLKANNKVQFEIIETLYLRLGFTMMLEWGNSHYIDNETNKMEMVRNTLIEDFWFQSSGDTHLNVLKKIENYRDKYDGNYDGMFAKVTNFNWSFNSDGSYDITIDLISLGDIVESFKVNVLTNPSKYSIKTSDSKENQNTITNYLNDLEKSNVTDDGYFAAAKEALTNEKTIKDLGVFNNIPNNSSYVDFLPIAKKGDYLWGGKDNSDRFYIKFGIFLEFIKTHVLTYYSNSGNDPFSIIDIDIDVESNVMSIFPNQISIDPGVALINSNYFSPPLNVQYESHKYIFTDSPLASFFSKEVTPHGKIMNIYLNFNFIKKTLKNYVDSKGNLSLYQFIKSLCDGLNKSLGGVNNLEPIVNEEENKLVIIDQNPLPKNDELRKLIKKKLNDEDEEENSFPLDLYGYNQTNNSSNFVKSYSFQTEISPSLASTITIGATAAGEVVGSEATAFSQWNQGLTDRFKQFQAPPIPYYTSSVDSDNVGFLNKYNQNEFSTISSGDPTLAKAGQRINVSNYKNNLYDAKEVIKNNFLEYLKKCFGKSHGLGYANSQAKYTQFDSDFISIGYSSFSSYINGLLNEEETTSTTLGFIPIKLEITLDGLSGIKIYQKLKINNKFLPSNYPDVLEFLIRQVNHELKDNQWTTTIETISIPKIKEIPIEDFTSSSEVLTTNAPDNLVFSLPVINPNAPTVAVIRNDSGGEGGFLKNREGEKLHRGLDLSTEIGQKVYAPIPGIIQKSAATSKSETSGIKILGSKDFTNYTAYIFYMKSSLPVGTTVIPGQLIGYSEDLSKDYPEEVTDHVHFSLKVKDKGKEFYLDPEHLKYKENIKFMNDSTLNAIQTQALS